MKNPTGSLRMTILLLCLLAGLPGLSLAQDRGGITGTVSDPSGAGIPDASVKVTNIGRGEAIELRSTTVGLYSASNLIPGTYTVTVTVPSFRTSTLTGIEVRVGEITRADVQLQVGEITQSIEVSAAGAVLKTDSSDVGSVVATDVILNLPLQVAGAARDPLAFAKLTPGFAGSTANAGLEYQTFYSVSGGQSSGTSVLIDGADVTLTSVQSQVVTGVTVEAVEEFKVMSSNYSAEYGRSTGGIINLTLKSGTNDFHGSGYEFLRNDKLDARGFFNPERQVNRQNDFGGLFSGPVRLPKLYNGRDRTFFMVAYEGFRYRQGALGQIGTYPIDDFRHGDFSKLVDSSGKQIPIYDPSTTQVLADGTVVRQQFPGNVIPANRIDPVAQNVLPLIPPLDYTDRLTNNILSHQQNVVNTDILTLKVDHAFNSAHKLTFSYSQAKDNNLDQRAFGPLGQSGHWLQKTKYTRLAHDYVITPRLLNHVQFGYSRRWCGDGPLYPGDYASQIGLKNVGNTQFPIFNIDGYYPATGEDHTFGGGPFANNFGCVDNSYQFNEALSYTRGRHSLKFGGEIRKQQYNVNDLSSYEGSFGFGSAQTGLPGSLDNTGDPFASFLLGAVSSGNLNYLGSQSAHRFASMGIFAQDDIKWTSRLTFNLGLRYERFWPMSDANGRLTSFDPRTANPGADGRPGALIFAGDGPGRTGSNRFQEIYNKAFGPRVGLAYQLNSRTVMRAGYGIYYQELKEPGWGEGNEGFFTNVTYNSADGFSQAFKLGDGFPTDFPKPPFIDPTFSNDRNVAYADPASGRPPVAQNWQLSIERQISQKLLVEGAYVGSNGHHLITRNVRYNQVDPRYLALGSLLRADIDSIEAQAAGIQKPYSTFSGTVAQALRPFPQYRNISTANTFGSDKTGNSSYHAFQFKLHGQLARDLTLFASYTFSKNLTDGANNRDLDGYQPNLGSSQDGFNRRAEKSLAALDIPHNFVVHFLYDLPFGPGKARLQSGVVSKLLGGWALGAVLTYQSGLPIGTPSPVSSNVPLFAGGIRPDLVPGVSSLSDAARSGSFDPGRDVYLNSAAWSSPAPFLFGNAPRISDARIEPLRGDDVSILKNTAVGEKVRIQFRAEIFNLFNRTQFSFPSADLGSSDFGMVFLQQNRPRTIQVGLKVIF